MKEYKTRMIDTKGFLGGKVDVTAVDELLNSMAKEGWSLSNTTTTAIEGGKTRFLVCVFEREI